MSLYRWFKTQVYWSIPKIFRNTNPNDFIGDADLVTIYKHTEDSNVYENKKVTLNQLAGLVGGGSQGPVGPMGPQGPAGPAVPSGLKWMGEYNSEANYALNDVVTWINPDTDVLGSYWVTSEEGVYDVPPTDENGNINEGWAFLASQGAQGIQGVQGEQGPVGPQGPAGSNAYKEVFFRTAYSNGIQYGFSTLTTNNLSIYSYEAGRFILTINNANDRPSSVYKIEVNADVVGGYGLADDVWRVAVDASAASITGEIVFYTYKYNTTTNVFQLANPVSAWHPVHIRIYS